MHIEVQVEEPSAKEALEHILPKIISDKATFLIINYGGKRRLLTKLPDRLKAYRARIDCGEALKLLILVDCDDDNCVELKARLEAMARGAGLATKSAPGPAGDFAVVNRIAVEELEAWFLGDGEAVRNAFPRVRRFEARAKFRDPDGIHGGTWEALHRLLQNHNYYGSAYPKIEVARCIALHMNITTNRSRSFSNFRSGVESLFA
jgi:hypothetical protein